MNSKRFLEINVYKEGSKMINITNIALIEHTENKIKLTMNIKDQEDKQKVIMVNEDYPIFAAKLRQMDDELYQQLHNL